MIARESAILTRGEYGGTGSLSEPSSLAEDEDEDDDGVRDCLGGLTNLRASLSGVRRPPFSPGAFLCVRLETWTSSECVDERMKSTTRCGILADFLVFHSGQWRI